MACLWFGSISKEKKGGSEVEQANDRSSGYTSVLELRKTTVSSFANHQIVIQELLGSGNFGTKTKNVSVLIKTRWGL